MAKRKRTSAQAKKPSGDFEFDTSASKLRINTYEDVADSEDEFHGNRDKILLDGGPDAKRRRRTEDEMIEASDEEVLGYMDSEEDDEEEPASDEEPENADAQEDVDYESEASGEGAEEEEDETTGWGTSKADFYNADAIETEQDALDEETEARRLQQKRLKALRAADFGFDETEWLENGKEEQDDEGSEGGLVTEVLPQLQISEDMGPSERLKLLNTRYPEFELLAKQLVELQPMHAELSVTARAAQREQDLADSAVGFPPIEVIKFQALSGYLGALAMYFAILTSTAKEPESQNLPMAPHTLQNHEIMASLMRTRDAWERVKDLTPLTSSTDDEVDVDEIENNSFAKSQWAMLDVKPKQTADASSKASSRSQKNVDSATAASLGRRQERIRRTEESLAALSDMPSTASSSKRAPKTAPISTPVLGSDDDSDLGDEPLLAPHEAAEKALRKKSLRFYTSQIAQRANKRANAGRAAGGDDDLPYRERFRDRQERLTREAANKVKKGGADDTALRADGGSDGEMEYSNRERNGRDGNNDMDDEYTSKLESKVRAKKDAKSARDAAYAQAAAEGGKVVVYPDAKIGPDGRREVGYVIEKNKGLMPRRKKDVKNPRVKKRKAFEKKSIKLRSMKATYKGGEGKGGYGGELTGIKKGLVRSVKL